MANLEHETDFEDQVTASEESEVEAESEAVLEDENIETEEGHEEESEETVEEETTAAASLKTHGVAGKADAMAHLLGHMNSMSKGEAIDFFQKVMAQFGPGKDYGVSDKSGSNQATLDMKPSHAVASKGPKTADGMPRLDSKNHWAEDVQDMFNGEDLTEDFKEKATVLFDAAVSARVIAEQARLQEEFEAALEEQVGMIADELSTKLDAYLNYTVENWMSENEVAIESTLRNEIMEEFIDGLKGLFSEHYINVPESKIDVLEALAAKVDALETKLDEAITENVELRNTLAEDAKIDVFNELASDLALTQQEKFAALAEGIEFDGDLETYARKLEIIKENYFETASTHTSNINEETFEGDVGAVVNVDPIVNRYVQAIARTVKNS